MRIITKLYAEILGCLALITLITCVFTPTLLKYQYGSIYAGMLILSTVPFILWICATAIVQLWTYLMLIKAHKDTEYLKYGTSTISDTYVEESKEK